MFPSRIIDTMHPLLQALRIRCCKHYASADAGGIHPLMLEASSLLWVKPAMTTPKVNLIASYKAEGKNLVGRDAINGVSTRHGEGFCKSAKADSLFVILSEARYLFPLVTRCFASLSRTKGKNSSAGTYKIKNIAVAFKQRATKTIDNGFSLIKMVSFRFSLYPMNDVFTYIKFGIIKIELLMINDTL